MIDVYIRQVDIIKQINTLIIINCKRKHYNESIYEYSLLTVNLSYMHSFTISFLVEVVSIHKQARSQGGACGGKAPPEIR